MASRKSINIYIPSFSYGGQKLHKYFCYLWVRGTSLLACSYIGELHNGRKLKCEDEPFIVFILILRRGFVSDLFLSFTQFELTAVGMNSVCNRK